MSAFPMQRVLAQQSLALAEKKFWRRSALPQTSHPSQSERVKFKRPIRRRRSQQSRCARSRFAALTLAILKNVDSDPLCMQFFIYAKK
ncbi:hypothetical protein [Halovulum sp. GXIMD14793]